MTKTKRRKPITWVVYRMTSDNQKLTGNAVCEQADWEAMEQDRPGYHTLLRGGIATEEEAEKLARGTSGDNFRTRIARKTLTSRN